MTATQELIELRKLAESAKQWAAAGFPVGDPHDTYPQELFHASANEDKVIALLDHIESLSDDVERLTRERNDLMIMTAKAVQSNDQLRARLEAQGEAVAIPADVLEAAKNMQKNQYRGPLAWAVKVIDFVADYTHPT
jgi:hypothetical protein